MVHPIHITNSKVYKSELYSCGVKLKDEDISIIDEYIDYLKFNKNHHSMEKIHKIQIKNEKEIYSDLENLITQQFYNNIINNESNNNLLQILSSLYKNDKDRFDKFPENSEKNKKYKFPFKKHDELQFILKIKSSEKHIQPRKYLIDIILT
jgi:hypothetical protein